MPDTSSWKEIAEILDSRNNFLLTTGSPDADAVGSMLAFSLALRRQGKSSQVYSPEPLPEILTFLPGMDHVIYQLPPPRFDAVFSMDTGSPKLLFQGNEEILKKISDLIINVDHHPDNKQFGNVNFVFPKAAATGEIIHHLLTQLRWPITREIATCLLTAIMADTGLFRYSNVTPSTYEIASELLQKGADNAEIARRLYATRSIPYGKLLGRMLENLQFDFNGHLVWSVLTKEDFKGCEVTEDAADKMVEQLDILKDVKVYALFRQWMDGTIKVSLRSRNNLPVNEVAMEFGGGGHRQAAGCQLTGNLKEVEEKVIAKLRALLSSSVPT